MKTKIVYALTSSENDFYLEQSWVSAYSAKRMVPDSRIVLVVDRDTDKTINGSRRGILDLIDEKIVVETPEQYNKVQTSRFLKTNLRKYVDGDYIFIDSDTIITDSLEEIDLFDMDMGAVLNLHVPLELHTKKDEVKVRNRICLTGYHIDANIPYFNSGVLFVRDNDITRTFYEKWHSRWKFGLEKSNLTKDQPAMAAANAEMGYLIKEIEGEWNCQVICNGLPYLVNSKIIHYFAGFTQNKNDKPYLFLDKSIYDVIKKEGLIPEFVVALIENAKGAFKQPCQVVVGDDLNILSSSLHTLAIKHTKIYNFLEMMAKIMTRIR